MITKQLSIHKSNDLDTLVTLLEKFYLLNKSPFQREPVVVYTHGIEQYIKKQLSKNLGVVANLDFQRPGAFFWYIARLCIPELKDKTNFFQPETMCWKILALFVSPNFESDYPQIYQEIHHHINRHQLAPYDLAKELAILFEHYMIYRPTWIETWSKNQLVGNIIGKEELWQKDLWLYLTKSSGTYCHRVEAWSQLKNILEQAKLAPHVQLPHTINLFSITSLAPLYLSLIELLANHIPVHLFILSPCQEEWTINQLENPLLESLGHQGRDFFKILIDCSTVLEQNLYYSKQTKNTKQISLLQQIQNDILYLNPPTDLSGIFDSIESLSSDESIKIQAAHNPVRELQILKNYLIQYLQQHPNIKLEEIAVLSPCIEQYLPYIDGVFGCYSTDSITLDYSITDVKIKNSQPYYSAITSILEFIASRFEVNVILNLLEHKNIRNQFNISTGEVNIIIFILKKLNICWGLDSLHRKNYHANNNQFTWDKGLKNLATLIDDNTSESSLLNFKNFCLDFNPNTDKLELTQQQIKTVIQQKLIPLIQILKSIYQNTNSTQKPISKWIEQLENISLKLIKVDPESELTQEAFFQQLAQLNLSTKLADFKEPVDYMTFKYIIQSSINTISNIEFLNKGITFGSLMPMRTIPFKLVALIGLNDQDFPRKNIHTSLDLIQKNRQPGDLSRREDDRYLFLETLICTQQTLYISFIGRSQKDEALNPSPLVNELIDLVANMTKIDNTTLENKWIIQHPLQNFSRKYFEPSTTLINYQTMYLEAYQNEVNSKSYFLDNYQPPEKTNSHDLNHHLNLALSELIKFWKSPTRYWLKHQLSIYEPRIDRDLNFTEPFSLLEDFSKNSYGNQPTKINDKGSFIIRALFNSILQKKSLSEIKSEIYNLDYLPSGQLADIWFHSIEKQLEDLLSTRLTDIEQTVAELLETPQNSLTVNLELGHVNLQGQLDYIFDNKLVFINYRNKLSINTKIQTYLKHLVYASYGHYSNTYMLGLRDSAYFEKTAQNTAKETLQKWLDYMQKGIYQPLPFFHQASFEIAKKLRSTRSSMSLTDFNLMQIELEEHDELKYFDNQLLFTEQELIVKHELFLPIIQDLIIPMLTCYKEIEI